MNLTEPKIIEYRKTYTAKNFAYKYLYINNRRFQNYYNHNRLGATPTALIKEGGLFTTKLSVLRTV